MRAAMTCVLLATVVPCVAWAADLEIAQPAPKLSVKEFIKGEPVKELEKGKVYVLEFWATWCGPCKEAIPHVSELQKKYKDVVFIGVAVWEDDQAEVRPFVREMGAKMDYRVALDEVPEGADAEEGQMAKHWLKAAGQEGIPATFLIDAQGRIAWIGLPRDLDKPLAEVVAGTWDVKAYAVKAKKEAELAQKLEAFEQQRQVVKAEAALKLIDELIKTTPDLEPKLGATRFEELLAAGKSAEAVKYGVRLVGTLIANDHEALHSVAFTAMYGAGADETDESLVDVAVSAAKRADEVAELKDHYYASTYADALHRKGKDEAAIAVLERAIKLAIAADEDEETINDLKDALAEIREAAGLE